MAEIGVATKYWQAWNFGVEAAGKGMAGFQKVTGLKVENSVIRVMEGGVHGVSEQSHGAEMPPGDVTFERGESADFYFENWQTALRDNPDDVRTFSVVQKHGPNAVERVVLESCALKSIEYGDFDRSAGDKERVKKLVLTPKRLKREAV